MFNYIFAGNKDTGIFCYRGIESLRRYIADSNNVNDKESWILLRETLEIEREKIDFIKSFADKTRHGGTIYISDENRSKIFNYTWDLVNKFIDYSYRTFIKKDSEVESVS